MQLEISQFREVVPRADRENVIMKNSAGCTYTEN